MAFFCNSLSYRESHRMKNYLLDHTNNFSTSSASCLEPSLFVGGTLFIGFRLLNLSIQECFDLPVRLTWSYL